MIKEQRKGILLLFILIVTIEILLHLPLFEKPKSLGVITPQIENKPTKVVLEKKEPIYHNFNPNIYSLQDWQDLGFSEKQAEVILKYKGIVGGEFTSKEQIKDCYVIDEEKYKAIEPYIQLVRTPIAQVPGQNKKNKEKQKSNKSIQKISSFNPNELDEEGWMRLGFSEKQATVIIKYKYSLGGEFSTKEELKKCYVISEKKYLEIEKYIEL